MKNSFPPLGSGRALTELEFVALERLVHTQQVEIEALKGQVAALSAVVN